MKPLYLVGFAALRLAVKVGYFFICIDLSLLECWKPREVNCVRLLPSIRTPHSVSIRRWFLVCRGSPPAPPVDRKYLASIPKLEDPSFLSKRNYSVSTLLLKPFTWFHINFKPDKWRILALLHIIGDTRFLILNDRFDFNPGCSRGPKLRYLRPGYH